MKKILALMLAAALALSLVACGGGSGAGGNNDTNTPSGGNGHTTSTDTPSGGGEDSTPQETEYPQIGDTVSTDKAEFVLKQFEFSEYLYMDTDIDRYLTPLTEEDIGTLDGNEKYGKADDNKVFAYIDFTIKNIGKTTLDEFSIYSNGNIHSCYIADYLQIDYDGYLFGFDNGSDIGVFYRMDISQGKLGGSNLNIDVLEPPYEFRGYLSVPLEVMENTEKSVFLNIQLPNENGDIEILTYKIR